MIEAQQYKIGFFVIGGIALVIFTLFIVGLNQLFEPTLCAVTTFDESVQGLESGSPVKLRGVPIGKVTNVSINTDEDKITVEMNINLRSFKTEDLRTFDAKTHFNKEVSNGLRCQLDFLGITGLKYVEMDYHARNSPGELLPYPENLPYHVTYIPSSKSLLSDLKTSVVGLITGAQMAINNFNQIEFEKLNEVCDESVFTLQEMRQFVLKRSDSFDNFLASIENTSNEIGQLSKQLQAFTDTKTIDPILRDIHVFSDETTQLVTDIRNNLEKLRLADRANTLDSTLHSVDDAANSFVEMRSDVNQLFRGTDETIRRLNAILKMLEENPSSILRGEKSKTYFKNPSK